MSGVEVEDESNLPQLGLDKARRISNITKLTLRLCDVISVAIFNEIKDYNDKYTKDEVLNGIFNASRVFIQRLIQESDVEILSASVITPVEINKATEIIKLEDELSNVKEKPPMQ